MPRPVKVLFVCLHGSAKSVIAREHFSRLALAAGLEVDASSAGLEPDDEIPPHVVRGLAQDGLVISEGAPRPVTVSNLAEADLIVSLGCEAPGAAGSAVVEQWDDLPAVSDGYEPARDAIVSRLRTLLAARLSGWAGVGRD